MIAPMLMVKDRLDRLADQLARAWSRETSYDPKGWSVKNPALGQCAVTALIVQDELGGELCSGMLGGVPHYWNRLPRGEEIDLTRHQFPDGLVTDRVEVVRRDYVLSFPDTVRRYNRLLRRVRSLTHSPS
jgi:hypothetical protein